MGERDSARGDASVRELAERLAAALVSVAAVTGERAQTASESLIEGGGELGDRWRGEAGRARAVAATTLAGIFRELGLVTRDEVDELELRVAQLEHRLRLLEAPPPPPAARGIQV